MSSPAPEKKPCKGEVRLRLCRDLPYPLSLRC